MERDKLLGTMDAKVWTDEFMATKARLGDEEFDRAMMLAWFANAIMAGFDEANRCAQRALDAAQELSAAWAEKARQYELELEGDPQNLHGQGRTFGLRSQLATLQAQLRQVEGERDQWIAANTKEPINEPVTYQALAGARFVAKRAFDELVKARSDLSALRQLVEVHTKQLTELTIIPIGCSREQELRWTQSIKDLRAALADVDAALQPERGDSQ